jgi:hypothetical protein
VIKIDRFGIYRAGEQDNIAAFDTRCDDRLGAGAGELATDRS